MTTLNGTINSTVDILRVSADNGFKDNGFRFRIDDEILAFLGYDRHDAAAILRVKSGDLTYWHVARAQDGTTAATHTSGATLYAVTPAFTTSSNLTPPDPYAELVTATPTLAEVLAEDNDGDGASIYGVPEIHAGAAASTAGESLTLYGNDNSGGSGGGVTLQGAGGTDGGFPASLLVAGADAGPVAGLVYVTTGGTDGDAGQALVSDGNGGTVWGFPGAAELVITEDASGAAGTYSGSIVVPGGATIIQIAFTRVAGFSNFNSDPDLIIGDGDDPNGFVAAALGDYSDGDTRVVVGNNIGSAYAGLPYTTKRLYSASDHEILVVLTAYGAGEDPPPYTGEVRILVTYAKPTPSAATFEAAP